MVNVYDYAHSLARALKESPEHKAYQAARARIKSKSSAESMVKDIHKRQLDLQMALAQGKEPTQAEKDSLEKLVSIAAQDPDVRDFLMAEQRLGTILNDVYKILGDALDVELPGR
jgi:cell fate (sporulation/competence/biofilm development) regulator YlbF (YheA/YmcA/DUF963 family)